MKKHLFVKAAWGLALAFGLAVTTAAPAQAQVKVIFDTDMDLDVDDAGALAVLHALADNGEAEILGVILDSPSQRHGNSRLGTATISAINTYYGRGGLPIGDLPPSQYMNNPPNYSRYRNYAGQFGDPGDGSTGGHVYYNEAIKSQFPNGNVAGVYNSNQLYRKLLASAPDNSVVVIGAGIFRAINDLMYTTGSDGYSSLTGKQLIAKKVKRLVLMTGEADADGEDHLSKGMNSTYDGLGDAARVFNEWPTSIVIMPLGGSINTGARLTTETPTSNPVRKSYEVFGRSNGVTGKNRDSWDQLAVLYGVRGADNIFAERTGKNITGEWVGGTYPLKYRWLPATSADKPDIYLRKDPDINNDQIAKIVEDLMVQGPKPKYAGELEAESAKVYGGEIQDTRPGYSGTGYVNYTNNTGDYIEWRVFNPANSSKNVRLNFVYASGAGSDRPLKLTVNGTQSGSYLPFGDTGGWANWQTQSATATLAAGANAVRLTVTGSSGPNMDYLAFEILQADTLQAEDAYLSGSSVSTSNSGYTGSGYAKYNGGVGNYIEWTINKANASQVNLKFRYANGYGSNKPLKLTVNGTTVDSSLDFNSTGGWSTWNITNGINANLVKGNNKVRLTATGEDNCIVDYLSFTSSPSSNPMDFSPQSAAISSEPAPVSAGSS